MGNGTEHIRELVNRKFVSGTQVVNCVVHMDIDLDKRPEDCPRCHTDIKNKIHYAFGVNEWLNQWKDDATSILEKQI